MKTVEGVRNHRAHTSGPGSIDICSKASPIWGCWVDNKDRPEDKELPMSLFNLSCWLNGLVTKAQAEIWSAMNFNHELYMHIFH